LKINNDKQPHELELAIPCTLLQVYRKVVITHSIGPECKARIGKEIQDLRISGEDPEDE
jgi:hypothetical protein